MNSVNKNNEVFCSKLKAIVSEKYLNANGSSNANIHYGPLETNDFSFSFGIDTTTDVRPNSIFVKIPKRSIIEKRYSERGILPISNEDRSFARDEFESLEYLSKTWKTDDISVEFVKPVDYIEAYNAIVTKRVHGENMFRIFRLQDMRDKAGIGRDKNFIHEALMRIGIALNRFHGSSYYDEIFNVNTITNKIKRYCSELPLYVMDSKFRNFIIERIENLKDIKESARITMTLKGLDLRNVLINKEGRISLLDPGKMSEDIGEADLARFIVTCRILYWGGVLFFLQLRPNQSYENYFVQGYYGSDKRPGTLLRIMIIKELLKQWRWAHVNLKFKHWPKPLKQILEKTYINPFYRREVMSELLKLDI